MSHTEDDSVRIDDEDEYYDAAEGYDEYGASSHYPSSDVPHEDLNRELNQDLHPPGQPSESPHHRRSSIVRERDEDEGEDDDDDSGRGRKRFRSERFVEEAEEERHATMNRDPSSFPRGGRRPPGADRHYERPPQKYPRTKTDVHINPRFALLPTPLQPPLQNQRPFVQTGIFGGPVGVPHHPQSYVNNQDRGRQMNRRGGGGVGGGEHYVYRGKPPRGFEARGGSFGKTFAPPTIYNPQHELQTPRYQIPYHAAPPAVQPSYHHLRPQSIVSLPGRPTHRPQHSFTPHIREPFIPHRPTRPPVPVFTPGLPHHVPQPPQPPQPLITPSVQYRPFMNSGSSNAPYPLRGGRGPMQYQTPRPQQPIPLPIPAGPINLHAALYQPPPLSSSIPVNPNAALPRPKPGPENARNTGQTVSSDSKNVISQKEERKTGNTVAISGLSSKTTEASLRQHLAEAGAIDKINIDQTTATVTFKDSDSAKIAKRKFHRSHLDENCITIALKAT